MDAAAEVSSAVDSEPTPEPEPEAASSKADAEESLELDDDPLSGTGTDPLSAAASDPLSQAAANSVLPSTMGGATGFAADTREEGFIPWAERRESILSEYQTDKTITIANLKNIDNTDNTSSNHKWFEPKAILS